MSAKIDLTGQPFGRLIVIREDGRSKDGKVTWLCRCLGKNGDDCGKEVVVRSNDLRSGNTKSCGCMRREQAVSRNTTHGCAQKTWYDTYNAMMQRCGHLEGASEYHLRN